MLLLLSSIWNTPSSPICAKNNGEGFELGMWFSKTSVLLLSSASAMPVLFVFVFITVSLCVHDRVWLFFFLFAFRRGWHFCPCYLFGVLPVTAGIFTLSRLCFRQKKKKLYDTTFVRILAEHCGNERVETRFLEWILYVGNDYCTVQPLPKVKFLTNFFHRNQFFEWTQFSHVGRKRVEVCQILFSFSSDKDRRTDSRIRRKNTAQPRRESNPGSCEFSQDPGFDSRRGCAVFFRLIRLSVLLSLSELKEKRIWLGISRQEQVYGWSLIWLWKKLNFWFMRF